MRLMSFFLRIGSMLRRARILTPTVGCDQGNRLPRRRFWTRTGVHREEPKESTRGIGVVSE